MPYTPATSSGALRHAGREIRSGAQPDLYRRDCRSATRSGDCAEETGLTQLPIESFTYGEEFKRSCRGLASDSTIFLIDHDLTNQLQNGLAVIEELGIAEHSVLVTGRFDDPRVQAKAQWLGVKILPKTLLPLVDLRTFFGVNDPASSI